MSRQTGREGRNLSFLSGVCLLACFVTLTLTAGLRSNPPTALGTERKTAKGLAPPAPEIPTVCTGDRMCSRVVSGTSRMTLVITATEDGLDRIREYQTPTFHQRIVSRSEHSVKVEVESEAVLNTDAPFPLNTQLLPSDVGHYLQATSYQQSDHPELMAVSQDLTSEATTEAQAVVGILDWVRANITYDYSFSLDRDALSVYRNRSGVCSGFSNLAVALLRAAGIPSRVQVGCSMWSLPHGGGHSWIEVYYADIGWVPSEPQGYQNFITSQMVAEEWPYWCGHEDTTIVLEDHELPDSLYVNRTPYSDDVWHKVVTAFVPAWDRHPLSVAPETLSIMVWPDQDPEGRLLEVENTGCYSTRWSLWSEADWIDFSPTEGTIRSTVLVSVEPALMSEGLNETDIRVYQEYGDASRTIPVKAWWAQEVHRKYLPLALVGRSSNQRAVRH